MPYVEKEISKVVRRHRAILNSTEKNIIKLLVTGSTNPEIGKAIGMKLSSVEVTLVRLFRKIGARNRTHAAALLVQNDYTFDPLDRFKGVPMKITRLNPVRSRKIKECPELW